MAKLNKGTRELMASAIMKHTYKEKAKALADRQIALFDRVYAYLYSKDERAAMDALLALDKDALPTTNSFKVNVGLTAHINSHAIVRIYVRNQADIYLATKTREQEHVPVMHKHTRWDSRINIPDGDKRDPKLHEDIRAWMTDSDRFRDETSIGYREALAALEGLGTSKKLREGWPEVLPLIESLIPDDVRGGLPAVQVTTLNAKFRLPPEKEAA